MSYYIFLVTVPNIDEGQTIAKNLVENKLAACVNIIKDVISIYRWKGFVQEDNEYLLIIKTTEEKSNAVIQKINEIHSYEIPECIGFKVKKGSNNYLNWIKNVVE
ncbi:MAG: divalent-cation tolerance protein CutA [Promethearchaeota archaeon]|jgi:periplasmic divalent cation tolerance protein